MQVSSVIYQSVIDGFTALLHVKCQTWFVQVPLLLTEAGARSMWCGSVRYVGIESRHRFCHGMDLSLYMPVVLAKRLSVPGLQQRPRLSCKISYGALDQSCQSEKQERPHRQRLHVGSVVYVFPSNEASVISQIMCNIRMSLKVYCLCS